jgi:hypothetical protein
MRVTLSKMDGHSRRNATIMKSADHNQIGVVNVVSWPVVVTKRIG